MSNHIKGMPVSSRALLSELKKKCIKDLEL